MPSRPYEAPAPELASNQVASLGIQRGALRLKSVTKGSELSFQGLRHNFGILSFEAIVELFVA